MSGTWRCQVQDGVGAWVSGTRCQVCGCGCRAHGVRHAGIGRVGVRHAAVSEAVVSSVGCQRHGAVSGGGVRGAGIKHVAVSGCGVKAQLLGADVRHGAMSGCRCQARGGEGAMSGTWVSSRRGCQARGGGGTVSGTGVWCRGAGVRRVSVSAVRGGASTRRCQRRRCQMYEFWGVAEDPRRGAGDRGAHHKGACVPTSVVENRAPLILLHCLWCQTRWCQIYNEKAPLVYKRSLQDEVSGASFRTITRVKMSDTRRVRFYDL
jgi:hypothetical protein